MQHTFAVRPDKRHVIPAVLHPGDGTSRIQTLDDTVAEADADESINGNGNGLYLRLVREFQRRTGVGMVLNTSFNTVRGEPIVEKPLDALRSFLDVEGIRMLVLGGYVVRRAAKDGNEEGSVVAVSREDVFERWGGGLAGSGVVSRTVESGGEIVKVEIESAGGREGEDWIPLFDRLQLDILQLCDGTSTIGEIYDALKEEGEGEGEDEDIVFEDVAQRAIDLNRRLLVQYMI